MKIISRTMAVRGLVLASLFAVLSSFSGNWGGDSYQVFVNNKLVLEEYVHGQKGIKSVYLDQQAGDAQVSVYYNHCGQVGKARSVTIRDGKNKILKEWTFADGAGKMMNFKAKEVLAFQKNADQLHLHYTSKELPEGKLLASIVVGKGNTVAP